MVVKMHEKDFIEIVLDALPSMVFKYFVQSMFRIGNQISVYVFSKETTTQR